MTLRLNGSSSGFTEIDAPAAAGSNTITLPTSNGSANQFLKNSSTAGTLGYSSMVEDSSGRLLVGTTSTYDGEASNFIVASSDHTGITVASTGANKRTNLYFADGTSGTAAYAGGFSYDHNDNSLLMRTASTARMRVTSDGGCDHFNTNADPGLQIANSQGAGASYQALQVRHSSTAFDTGTVSFLVFTNGNAQNTNNSYGSISDVKLKENIVDASSQWEDLKAVQVRNYNFKESTGHQTHTQIGVVAQEVETVSPGLVYETPDKDDDGTDLGTVTKSVNYSVLYMKAVKALQEAQTRIETLETKVAALEATE